MALVPDGGLVTGWSGGRHSVGQGLGVTGESGVQRGGEFAGPILGVHVVQHEVDRAYGGVRTDLAGADQPDDRGPDRFVRRVVDDVTRAR